MVFSGRTEKAAPDVSTKSSEAIIIKKFIIPEKFKDDIQKLFEFIGLDVESSCFSNLCITLSLQEALTLMPPVRKRSDAYNPVVPYLHDVKGIDLNIVSQKPKK